MCCGIWKNAPRAAVPGEPKLPFSPSADTGCSRRPRRAASAADTGGSSSHADQANPKSTRVSQGRISPPAAAADARRCPEPQPGAVAAFLDRLGSAWVQTAVGFLKPMPKRREWESPGQNGCSSQPCASGNPPPGREHSLWCSVSTPFFP